VRATRRVYRAFGLVLESACGLPCAVASAAVAPDVVIRAAARRTFAEARPLARPPRPRAEVRLHRFANGTMYLGWPGLFEFLVSPDGRHIDYRKEARVPLESVSLYLLGQVLSFALLARGVESLHATTVAIDGAAVALLGECGSGKSTLGAALLSRGHRLVSDDLLVLTRRAAKWVAEPGVPRLKLLPEARHLIGPRVRVGPPLVPGARKRIVALGEGQVVRRPLPLRGCYVLAPRRSGCARPRVAPLRPREACVELLRSAFNLAIRDPARLRRQLAFAARVAMDVPVRRLEYPKALARLPDVRDTLLASLV
jgi:hypothetical protein